MRRRGGERPARRVVHCHGIRGVLRQTSGSWILENEEEVRTATALNGDLEVLERFHGLTAALNLNLIDRAGLSYFNTCLNSLGRRKLPFRTWVPEGLLPAVALTCTYITRNDNFAFWLACALGSRLESNLSTTWYPFRTSGDNEKRDWVDSFSEIRWIDEMPAEFWDRLNARRNCCGEDGETEICLSSAERICLRTAAIASDPQTSSNVLHQLLASPNKLVLDMVASHPKAKAKTLITVAERASSGAMARTGRRHLLKACDSHTAWRAAQNRSASQRTLKTMADLEHFSTKVGVAQNLNTTSAVLHKLSEDEGLAVRYFVARHGNTAAADLRRLANDEARQVRASVASNDTCPPDLLQTLLRDSHRDVRQAAVENSSAPIEAVAPLATDRAKSVRAQVARRPDLPDEAALTLANDLKALVRQSLAMSTNIPLGAAKRLAEDPDEGTRYCIAENPDTPTEILEVLAEDQSDWVRQALVRNSATPSGVLVRIHDSSPETFPCHMEGIFAANKSTPPHILAELAESERHWVRAEVAANPTTPHGILRTLSSDIDAEVRANLASNPSTPCETLEQLTTDKEYRARLNAKEQLKQRQDQARHDKHDEMPLTRQTKRKK